MIWPLSRFDEMFAESDDPWAFDTRFYERRKRALTLAALDKSLYRRGFEPGCANGVLSADLAARCETLLVSDAIDAAVALARRRLASCPHVRVQKLVTPNEWPEGRFDLIVLSELGYFLEEAELQTLLARSVEALDEDGTLLLCHWRHPIEGCALTGDEVHERLPTHGLTRIAAIVEADFLLDVWSRDARSVGAREGLV